MIRKLEDLAPMGDYIVVTEFHAQHESKIVLPGKKTTDNSLFEVIAVGPGKRSDSGVVLEMRLAVGDIVIFPGNTPILQIHVSGENRSFWLLNEGNVVAKAGNVATTPRGEDPQQDLRAHLNALGPSPIIKA